MGTLGDSDDQLSLCALTCLHMDVSTHGHIHTTSSISSDFYLLLAPHALLWILFDSHLVPGSSPQIDAHYSWFSLVCFLSHILAATAATAAAAAAKSLQSGPTLCDPIDGSPPGSAVPGILQARALEWVPFPSPMLESEK